MSVLQDHTFLYWTEEREKVRRNREAGLPRDQWTNDPILASYHFCNVSREDDRVTKWIKENIRDPFSGAEPVRLFKALALARFINLPETLAVLLGEKVLSPDNIDWRGIVEVVSSLQDKKLKAFSSAYMVRSETTEESRTYGEGKIAYIAATLAKTPLPDTHSREAFTLGLAKQYGFGNFMAGQVAADAAYTPLLNRANDHYTWAPLGPGAMKGMNIALGREPQKSLTQSEYVYVGQLQYEAIKKAGITDRDLHLHDVASNVNCETFKYVRAQQTGKVNRKYYGEHK